MNIGLFTDCSFDASSFLRVRNPFRVLGEKVVDGKVGNYLNTIVLEQSHVIVMQRDFPRHSEMYKLVRETVLRNKLKEIYDVDDLLWYLPSTHPDFTSGYYREAVLPMLHALKEADLVTVPTENLQEFALNYNSNVKVLPNYFDDYLWLLRPPTQDSNKDRPVRIGYMGGRSHLPDLAIVAPAIKKVASLFGKAVKWIFWGIDPSPVLGSGIFMEVHPYFSNDYPLFAAYFQNQEADLFFAPLSDNPFNRCKSPLKYLEYSALGAPVVFSDIPPYSPVIRDGENGFLAKTEQEWQNKLISLIGDSDMRYKIAMTAQDDIRKNWLLSEHYEEITNIYNLGNSN